MDTETPVGVETIDPSVTKNSGVGLNSSGVVELSQGGASKIVLREPRDWEISDQQESQGLLAPERIRITLGEHG
jgi:hypothetical protein